MIVYILNNGQRNMVLNRSWSENVFFYPIEDADGKTVISQKEANTELPEFAWCRNLTQKEHNPILTDADGNVIS